MAIHFRLLCYIYIYDMFKFYLINNSLNFNVPKIYIFSLEKLYIYFTLNLIKNAIRRNKKKYEKKYNASPGAFFLYKALPKPSLT